MKLLWLILVLALFPTAATAAPSAPLLSVPQLEHSARTLANGAELYAMRDPAAATVTVDVWYGVGQRDDPVARGGFAHLFEHLMFKQTRNLPGGVSDFISEIGGTSNATTLFDTTVYFTTAPANRLEALLWLEGERLRNLVIDQKNFDSERDVVKEELRQRIFARPYGRILHLLIPAHSFRDHPYARPIGGTIEELDAAPLADVRAFHEAYYRPDNAIFVVSGNFDPEQLDAWADRYLGSIPSSERPIPRDVGEIAERTEPRFVDAYAPNVPLPAVVFTWQAPPATEERAVAGLALIGAILTRGPSARLNRSLVHDLGVAADLSHYNFLTRDGHAFTLVATLAEGKAVAAGEAALAEQIARLRETPVSEAELKAAKNGILGDALRSRETPSGRAYLLGDAAFLTGDPAAADRKLALIREMTAEDVQRIAVEWLAENERVTIRYRDESKRPQGFEQNPGADIAAMGTRVPPPTRPSIAPASEEERVAPPEAGPPVERTAPALVERRLDNGLNVVVARSTELPLTTLELAIGGGDGADPEGLSGLADMTAVLVRRGTETRGPDDIATTVATLGGTLHTEAQADATIVRVTAPSINIAAAGKVLADVALNPVFTPDEVDDARDQQLAALAITAKSPVQLALRALPAIVFPDTRYEAVPTPASLAAITRARIAAAHEASWTPANATLVITGSMPPEEGFALAEQLFGGWDGGPPPAPAAADERDYAPQVVAVDLPGAGQTAVLALFPTPARSEMDYDALQLANAIVGGGWTAWLSQEIRVKRGLSYGAGSLLMLHRHAGAAVAVAQTKNESALEVAELIQAQFARLGSAPQPAALIAERKAYLATAAARRTETTSDLADYLASSIADGVPLPEASRELSGENDAAAAAVKAIANTVYDPSRASLLLVGDAEQWIDALRERYPGAILLTAEAVGADSDE